MSYLEKWFEYTNRQLAMKKEIEQAITEVGDPSLDLNKFLMLYFLSKSDQHRLMQNELQDKLHLSPSAISRMIARMEAKNCGVIEKTACQTDKRATYIQLTTEGEELLAKVLVKVEQHLENYREFLR